MELDMNSTLPYRTYAENIRMAAKAKRLSIRDLANRTQFSYEHIRKIWIGHTPKRKDSKFTVGRECNDLLCNLLDLPAEAMFEMAEREKFAQKNGYAPIHLPDPIGQEMADVWERLEDEQKSLLLRMGRTLATEKAMVSAAL
jgi:transcriptional regulator with XRE-family HTH domain